MSRSFFASLKQPIIANIHLLPLPGTASYDGAGLEPIVERALADGRLLMEAGVDAILVQNNGDMPASVEGHPETIAYMTMICTVLGRELKTPLGVNILANGTESALAVAHASNARFVRIKVYVGAVIGAVGLVQAAAHRAQEFIRLVGASGVEIAADVYDRASRPLGDLPIEEAAVQAAVQGRAQALVITGSTVQESFERVRRVRTRIKDRPIYVGGGTNAENVAQFLQEFDGVIVGKALKKGPNASGPIDRELLMPYMDAVNRARSEKITHRGYARHG